MPTVRIGDVAEVVAYLVTKEYIVVTEPIITYTGDAHEPFSGRGNPLRQVEVKTVTTPPIDFDPSVDPGIKVGALGSDTDYVLWVRSGARRRPVLVCQPPTSRGARLISRPA